MAKIAFTGSVATGRRVALAAAQIVRPCCLELGGKSALVVFDDADIDKAVEWAMVCKCVVVYGVGCVFFIVVMSCGKALLCGCLAVICR